MLLEKIIAPEKLVGKKLKVEPFQHNVSTIYDTKNDIFWRYELIYRINKENIASVKIYEDLGVSLNQTEIKKNIFSRYRIINSPSPLVYSKNSSIFQEEFEERDEFLKKLNL